MLKASENANVLSPGARNSSAKVKRFYMYIESCLRRRSADQVLRAICDFTRERNITVCI